MDIAAWLHRLGLERYAQAFHEHDIDAQTLAALTAGDLREIGVKSVGHRRRLMGAIVALQAGAAAPAAPSGAASPAAPSGAERRQLTVLCCDMVGSTALSQRLHPEDLSQVIQAFQQACARTVADYDGHVANFIGDCVLAYFGWPRAHEDDGERAVRAGRALAQALGALRTPTGEALAVRVGIASGPVVVGDLIREGPAQSHSAVGSAPDVAAQLQTLASPGQVVIDELTRRLVASSFALQPLGRHALKGMHRPVAVHAVGAEQATDSRFEAHKGQQVDTMVGREHELALLLERWAQAKGGEGQAVLLVGEAGMGKSRMARALLDATAGQPQERIRWQCSSQHSGSTLWPVIDRLRRAAGIELHDPPEAALDKLEALSGPDPESRALFALALGLDVGQRYGALAMTPQVLRTRTLKVMADRVFEMARERPVLLLLEDVHWIDPTTRELIERCLEGIESARLLILMTTRSDDEFKLTTHSGVTRLSLNRLGRASMEAIVARMGGDRLEPQARSAIVAQSKGVPLFAEELTKAVLETGEDAITASLHGSLMARLDRIADAREAAQIAACIGREFEQALVEAVAERPDAVRMALEQLVGAGLMARRSDESRLAFRHALVQEVVCESMLSNQRESLHARILAALEAEGLDTPAAILAHHAESARQADKAIEYWSRAAQLALGKSAYREAAGFLDHAIGLIQAQEDGIDRRERELELQLQLGQAGIAARGFGTRAGKKAFTRAQELLAAEQGNAKGHLQAHFGLWARHITRAELQAALALAEKCLAAAQLAGPPENLLFAHRMVAGPRLFMGDFAGAHEHYEKAMPLLDSSKRGELTMQLGVDPAIQLLCYFAWLRCIEGYTGEARRLDARAHEIGASLPHVHARAQMHMLCGFRAAFERDDKAMAADAQALARLAAEHGLSMYKHYADLLLGWPGSQGSSGVHGSLVAFSRTLERLLAGGARFLVPFCQAQLALALAASGRDREARFAVERALDECEETAQGWCDAELWRVHGEVCWHDGQGDAAEAVQCFERSLELARGRGARLWELRAAVSLARLWRAQGEPDKALGLLAPVFDGFSEGFDGRDLVEAQTLLAELRAVPAKSRAPPIQGVP